MEETLTHDDYLKVLDYYNIPMPKTRMRVKKAAEQILAEKLCRCIKRVKRKQKSDNTREPVGICRTSVIYRKNLDIFRFKCNKNPSLKNFKGKSYKIKKRAAFQKTRKNKRNSE